MKTMHPHGMSPNNSNYGEPIGLSDGQTLQVIEEDDNTYAFHLSPSHLTARYRGEELEAIGEGSVIAGTMNVVRAIAERPDTFAYKELRPFEPL